MCNLVLYKSSQEVQEGKFRPEHIRKNYLRMRHLPQHEVRQSGFARSPYQQIHWWASLQSEPLLRIAQKVPNPSDSQENRQGWGCARLANAHPAFQDNLKACRVTRCKSQAHVLCLASLTPACRAAVRCLYLTPPLQQGALRRQLLVLRPLLGSSPVST